MAKRIDKYSVLLISPSDVQPERDAVTEAVARWNAKIGDGLGATVEVVRWETHSVPDASAPAQKVLNRQIVDECDFGIGLFKSRLGTPTDDHESGSIEEIERLRQRGARVMTYFSSAPIEQDRLRDDQFARLQRFKEELGEQGLLGSYKDIADLREQIMLDLTDVVTELLRRERGLAPAGSTTATGVLTAPKPDVQIFLYPAETLPPTPGIKHLLAIRVENHSPVVVYISGISILLTSGKGLWLYRDAVSGAEQTRRALQPGESFQWSVDGGALLRDHAVDDFQSVMVQDDIRRAYYDAPGALKAILEKWKAEDAEKQ